MVSRKQAFMFFLGELLSIYGLHTLIRGGYHVLSYVIVFGLGGLFLVLGRQVFFERKAIFARHWGEIIVSSISAGIIILLSLFMVYIDHKVYPASVYMAGLGETLLALFLIYLILGINIIMWLIVLIMSWRAGRSSGKPENRDGN
ncbi:MAG: hypothetical protein GXY06_03305 [Clostridiaceae bacterium]|nr:hypothetical protein [Clostridiaceae bacterium]